MPLPGIYASSIRVGGPSGAYDSLATVTVPSGGVASVTFAGIPSGYKHLQIRSTNRSNRGSTYGYYIMSFNGDSTNANYFWGHNLAGSGSGAAYADTFGSAAGIVNQVPGGSSAANVFGGTVTDILDYSSVNKNKTVRTLSGHDFNGSGYMIFGSGLWMSTAAITSIKLTDAYDAFAQYTQFALYGVK